eukprot:12360815-Ditylum_brightwellii.AAC.2
MACCLVALDKCPGTRPVGIGEILQCLIAKMVIQATGAKTKLPCKNLQLCTGLEAGIKGAVHVVSMRHKAHQKEPADATEAGK